MWKQRTWFQVTLKNYKIHETFTCSASDCALVLDIVLNDFSDEQRKKLLFFSTGSDRAPITGLEDIEFVIGLEPGDEEKLPTAHTCFN